MDQDWPPLVNVAKMNVHYLCICFHYCCCKDVLPPASDILSKFKLDGSTSLKTMDCVRIDVSCVMLMKTEEKLITPSLKKVHCIDEQCPLTMMCPVSSYSDFHYRIMFIFNAVPPDQAYSTLFFGLSTDIKFKINT